MAARGGAKTSLVALFLIAVLATLSYAYVPPHIPMNVIGPTSNYTVPWWLGGYSAQTNESSDWYLPPTYLYGGKTPIGTTLVIQNQGPYNITLHSTAPETIQGQPSYLILASSTAEFLSSEDWIVTSSTYGAGSTDGVFTDVVVDGTLCSANNRLYAPGFVASPTDTCDASNLRYVYPPNGWGALSDNSNGANSASYWNATDTSRIANLRLVSSSVPTLGGAGVVYGLQSEAYSNGPGSAVAVRGYVYLYSQEQITSNNNYGGDFRTYVRATGGSSSVGSLKGFSSSLIMDANATGTFANLFGGIIQTSVFTDTPVNITNLENLRASVFIGGNPNISINSIRRIVVQNGISAGATVTTNAGIAVDEMLNGVNNVGIWLNSNNANSGSGMCAGVSRDTCLWRAAANAWTFNSGTSLRVPQYISAGSSNAPTNTAAGAISTTIASPALQAFGAVTANAASGILAFTVSTAAQACSTATITNTNVATTSEVILTMQGYTGTKFTNGIPAVARANTAGSSSGSFILELCNLHATNALSGNLYIAYWVLN